MYKGLHFKREDGQYQKGICTECQFRYIFMHPRAILWVQGTSLVMFIGILLRSCLETAKYLSNLFRWSVFLQRHSSCKNLEKIVIHLNQHQVIKLNQAKTGGSLSYTPFPDILGLQAMAVRYAVCLVLEFDGQVPRQQKACAQRTN